MATEVEELVGFLSSPSPQVKKAAVDIVQGLTGSEEGLKSLANYSDTLLASLLNLLGDKKEFVQPVLEALINLSQETALAGKMVDIGIIEREMEILGKVDPSIIQLLSMLLVNLTHLDSGVERLLQTGTEKLQGLYIAKLVRLFSTSSSENEEDPYGHIGSILMNISRMETGRKLLLDPKWSLLKQLLRQIDSPSTLRRKGVSGTLRNCCFESETQLANLLLLSQFLWPALLLPLAGKQEYSKEDTNKMPLELANPLSHEREPENDPEIRVQAAEALYLIAVHEGGRKALWSVNGPRILEIGYQYEEDPKVMEAYERLGSLLVQSNGVEDAK
ncbi:uncharacterized protein LOC131076879 isoform X2 [Cryptomeria japonica]|uniref:uncharacterized protein LOC131076879 isoform X2 n=1 Tax=Cryptomeria japonica TaxID=3369 RepID=UPI0027D9E250|nr:uncharacterized protein LOC131076879 isoform X2 [Cryptomeria japonica]